MSEKIPKFNKDETPTGIPRSLFRVGNPSFSEEVSIGNRRLLLWEEGEHDDEISSIAGWMNREVSVSQYHINTRAIELPQGTRPAEKLIAGFESYRSEKRSILDRVIDYEKKVFQKTSMVDVSVSLGTIAVTRDDQELIIIPPHELSNDRLVVSDWQKGLADQVWDALEGTTTFESPDALIEDFKKSLVDIQHKR